LTNVTMVIDKLLLLSVFFSVNHGLNIPISKGQLSNACDIGPGLPIGELHDADVDEASGLAVSETQEGILWTHNDHGDKARVYALNRDGTVLQEVTLEGIDAEDFEDIAINDGYIHVSDTGNNNHDKERVRIMRFKEPTVLGGNVVVSREDIEVLQVRYPDFSYDCEALTIDPVTRDIFLFTKDREEEISEVFRYPAPQSESLNPFTLEHVGTLPLYWITGGDISPSGSILGLTNKQVAFGLTKPDGQDWAQFLASGPEICTLHLEDEEQRESIAVTDNGYWTTSECDKCPIWYYPRF